MSARRPATVTGGALAGLTVFTGCIAAWVALVFLTPDMPGWLYAPLMIGGFVTVFISGGKILEWWIGDLLVRTYRPDFLPPTEPHTDPHDTPTGEPHADPTGEPHGGPR